MSLMRPANLFKKPFQAVKNLFKGNKHLDKYDPEKDLEESIEKRKHRTKSGEFIQPDGIKSKINFAMHPFGTFSKCRPIGKGKSRQMSAKAMKRALRNIKEQKRLDAEKKKMQDLKTAETVKKLNKA